VHPDRDDLAHFMALYYATMGAIALLLQLLLTRQVLRRFGVAGGMLALPLAYLLANVGLLLFPGLQFATVVKVADNAFQYTIFEATLQLLYFPLPAEAKENVRSFLEAIAKPLGYGLAGVLVLALRVWWQPDSMPSIAAQSWIVLPLVLGWIAMVPVVRRRYLDSLERSLTRREADPGLALVDDAHTREVLQRTLAAPSPRAAIFALEQLAALDPKAARSALPALLESPEAAVRAAALRTARSLVATEVMAASRKALDDPDETVAAAAAETFGELAGEECLPVLAGYVHSRRRKLEDAVLATLLRRGGLEGTLAAGRVVETWLASSDADDRVRAAKLLARPGIPGLQRIVRRLLEDADPAVRRATLDTAGAVGDPGSSALVLQAMRDPAAARAAARALVAIGEPAVALVDGALGDPHTPSAVRLGLPRVLAQIRTRTAYEALVRHIDTADEWLRQKVLASASRARAAGAFEPLPLREASPRMLREIETVTRLREQYVWVRASLAIPMLDRWLLERLRKGLIRVLRLGELSHPKALVAAARDAIFAHDLARRARAVEMLENILELDVRARFVAELDALLELRDTPLPRAVPLRGGEEAFVRQLAALSEPFAKVLALDAAQFRRVRLPDETMEELTRDEDPAVREMAALAVATFRPLGWRDILGHLRSDADGRVRTYAEYAYTTGRTGMDPSDEMYTTLEKVLFLQRIPLFADVPPEHLVPLARSAEVEHRVAGTLVFRGGDPGDALYFVIDGRVRVLSAGRAPIELGEGEVFGEMSVLDSSPRSADVEVTDDATLLRIEQEDFYDVLRETAELAEGVIHVLVRRLRAISAPG
jgi:HEAT repeat protein